MSGMAIVITPPECQNIYIRHCISSLVYQIAHPFRGLYNGSQPRDVCISGRSHPAIAVLVLRDI